MQYYIKRLLLPLVALGLLLLVILAGVLFVEPKIYTGYIKQQTIAAAKARGISLTWGKSSLRPIAFTAYDLEIFVPRLFLPLRAPRVTLSSSFSSLITFNPLLDVEGELYGGFTQASLLIDRSGNSLPRRITLNKVELGKHPQLAALGLSGGLLSINLPEIKGESVDTLTFSGKVELEHLAKPRASTLPAFVTGFALTLPAIEDLSLSTSVVLEESKLSFPEIVISGSLGQAEGRAVFQKNSLAQLSYISAELKVTLSDKGLGIVGAYLPLFSSGQLTQDNRHFMLGINGPTKHPQVRFWAR